NVIIRGLHLCDTEVIEVTDLGLSLGQMGKGESGNNSPPTDRPFKTLKQETIETFERDYLIRLMAAHHGNVTKAARSAGKERRDFGKLLKKYHLDPNYFRAVDQFTQQ